MSSSPNSHCKMTLHGLAKSMKKLPRIHTCKNISQGNLLTKMKRSMDAVVVHDRKVSLDNLITLH
jgi:hypothetical protein